MTSETLEPRPEAGGEGARTDPFRVLHGELRRLAEREMGNQPPGHTLQPTALVHEAYLKLRSHAAEWNDRHHFLRLAAKAMRQILVDHARGKTADRRAPPGRRLELDSVVEAYEERSGGLVALNAALDRLESRDPELVQLVELRFFCGHTMDETAEILGLSPRSAARRWNVARVFLRSELEG